LLERCLILIFKEFERGEEGEMVRIARDLEL
jgi:hypothetical protein